MGQGKRDQDGGRGSRRPLTVAIIQPAYLPWLGYFDQMAQADVFVHYDDVQYSRRSWHSRNRVKTPAGADWLSVPVVHTGRPQTLQEARVDGSVRWKDRHLGVIQACYRQAPHFNEVYPWLADFMAFPWEGLAHLNIQLGMAISAWLGIKAPELLLASDMGIPADLDTTARPLQICQAVGATRFVCGPTAKAYINAGAFEDAGVELVWHEYEPVEYPQLWGEFVPRLAALDALLMLGPKAGKLVGR